MDDERFELEPASPDKRLRRPDDRPTIPEPPAVTLVSIDDVRLNAAAGQETALDAFYVGLLGFWRETDARGFPIYKAENARIIFNILESTLDQTRVQPVGIEKPSLEALRQWMLDEQIEYIVLDGFLPGDERLLVRDPAGNWLSLAERIEIG